MKISTVLLYNIMVFCFEKIHNSSYSMPSYAQDMQSFGSWNSNYIKPAQLLRYMNCVEVYLNGIIWIYHTLMW